MGSCGRGRVKSSARQLRAEKASTTGDGLRDELLEKTCQQKSSARSNSVQTEFALFWPVEGCRSCGRQDASTSSLENDRARLVRLCHFCDLCPLARDSCQRRNGDASASRRSLASRAVPVA